MLLNSLNKGACIINLIKINILFYYIAFKGRGTICPPVQNDGVLFVSMCKSMGYPLVQIRRVRGWFTPLKRAFTR